MISQKRIWAVVCLTGALWVGTPAFGLGGDEGVVRHVSKPIPGQYIVVLRDSVVEPSVEASILSARAKPW